MLKIKLRKYGMDFYGQPETDSSDVGCYRVGTNSEEIMGKDGRMYYLDFSHCVRYTYRETNKVTGKPLKHPIKELLNINGLHIDTQYTINKDGCNLSYRNCEIEKTLWDMNLDYTISGIETALEYITGEKCQVTIEE